MIEIDMHLFGKPEWEFDGNIDSIKIRTKGGELNVRLQKIANAMDKLTAAGWDHYMTLYDLRFSKSLSKTEAKSELKELNIDEEIYHIEECEDEAE